MQRALSPGASTCQNLNLSLGSKEVGFYFFFETIKLFLHSLKLIFCKI